MKVTLVHNVSNHNLNKFFKKLGSFLNYNFVASENAIGFEVPGDGTFDGGEHTVTITVAVTEHKKPKKK